jgi:hypothetical protein
MTNHYIRYDTKLRGARIADRKEPKFLGSYRMTMETAEHLTSIGGGITHLT